MFQKYLIPPVVKLVKVGLAASAIAGVGILVCTSLASAGRMTSAEVKFSNTLFASSSHIYFSFNTASRITSSTYGGMAVSCYQDPCAAIDITFPRVTSTDVPYFTLSPNCPAYSPETSILISAGDPANYFTVVSATLRSSRADSYVDTMRFLFNLNGQSIATGTTMRVDVNDCWITNPVSSAGFVPGVYEPYNFTIQTGVSNTPADYVYSRLDSADTKTAFGDGTIFSAQVNSIFSFTVGPMTSTTRWGTIGEYPSVDSTSSSCPFGTLTPNVPKTCGQTLRISTNAPNGYAVYLALKDFLKSGANQIEGFVAGGSGGAGLGCYNPGGKILYSTVCNNAIPWQSPYALVNNVSTWGELGYSSDDTDVFTTSTVYTGISFADMFAYAVSPVMASSTAAAPGPDITHSKLKIEISPLQPAGHYTGQLIYIATPNY